MASRTIVRACVALALALSVVAPAGPALAQGVPAPIKPAAALAPDVAYARFVALIRAHLRTSDDLAAAKQWRAAAMHAGFPREEIYGVIRDELAAYRTPAFEVWLKAVVQAAQAGDIKRYKRARQKVDEALAAADANLKTRQADWPRFLTKVAAATLTSAPDEYDDAVAKDRIVRPVGYQTARGIILEAARLFEAASAGLTGDAAASVSGIGTDMTRIQQAFASVLAPKQPVMEPDVLRDLVSKMTAAAVKAS